MGRYEPVRITLSQGKMEIEAESDIGRAKEVVAIDYEGEGISMNFNVRFVMDVISHINGDTVIMSAPSTYGAVLFREEGDGYKNIVMPIRV
jgi:DNA polymerase-3 subunit beta